MVKRLVLSATIIFCSLFSFSQLSVGGGVGVVDTTGIGGQLKIQYEFKRIGFQTGWISAPFGTTLFNFETFIPLRFDDYSRMTLHGGYVYRMMSTDDKRLNGTEWIAGANVEWGVGPGAVYLDVSVTQRKFVIFMLGWRGIFGEFNKCL